MKNKSRPAPRPPWTGGRTPKPPNLVKPSPPPAPPNNVSEIGQPFDPAKLSASIKTTTVHLVMSRLARQEIDLNPDYQRNARIWDRTTRSRLIESLLLRIPLSMFHVAADNNDHWHVVDGLQRLYSLKSFVLDKTLKLHRLEYFTQFERFSYDDLPRRMQRRINDTELAFHVVDTRTPDTVMFNVFKRVATGGKPLTPREIRLRSIDRAQGRRQHPPSLES